MRNNLKKFWGEPVNHFWIICAFGTLFILCFGTYTFFKESFAPVISLGLISVALVSELLFLIAIIINIFADTKREYLKAFQEINRDLRYRHYQNKNNDKEYKGPNWNDDNFVKISDLKNRVDSFVKASTEYQQVDFKRWKKSNVDINLDHSSQTAKRVLSVIIASFISLFILFTLCKWLKLDSTTISILIKDSRSPVLAALITTVITSPVIFIIWLFRDKNNRVQIENARKDTNLKDFQKLSEWASGFHLPEIKKNTGSKITIKTIDNIREIVEETTNSIEDFIVHESSNSISRRQGAEALQASAIAQLEAFMFGKYGEQFMQPAFLLIHAIWESAITQQQINHPHISDFNKALNQLHKNPIISALNRALVGANGYHLRLFESSLKNINLSGLMVNRSDNSKKLNLIGLTLTEVDLSHAALDNTQMQGATLKNSNFDSTSLTDTDLHGADLRYCEFNYTIFEKAKLRYTNLEGCMLQGVTLRSATLEYANFQSSSIVDCNFKNANLKGANLKGALLDNNNFKNALINRFTLFGEYDGLIDQYINENEIREDILSKYAIWDDDPIWLTDKFNDKILLNNVIKRSKDFASGYVFF